MITPAWRAIFAAMPIADLAMHSTVAILSAERETRVMIDGYTDGMLRRTDGSFSRIRRTELASLDDWSQVYAAVHPVILTVRARDQWVKMDVYRTLSDCHKRLFIFVVYYSHAKESEASFLFYSRYFIGNNHWDELKRSVGFFCKDALEVFETISRVVSEADSVDDASDLFGVSMGLCARVIQMMAAQIRENPNSYFEILDE